MRYLCVVLLMFTVACGSSNLDVQDTEQNSQNWHRLNDRVRDGHVVAKNPEEQLAFETDVETSTHLADAMHDNALAAAGKDKEEEEEGDDSDG